MLLALVVAAGLSVTAAEAAAPAASGPCLVIADTPELRPSAHPATASGLPGTYLCDFREGSDRLTARLVLAADGSFDLTMREVGDAVEERRSRTPGVERTLGRWLLHGSDVTLVDIAVAPVLTLVGATHDADVSLSIDVRTPDGAPAKDLVVRLQNDNSTYAFTGTLTLALDQRYAGMVRIAREGDAGGGIVGEAEVRSGGPNNFRFIYDPEVTQPGSRVLQIAGADNAILVLPAGLGALLLRKLPR